MKIDLKQYNEFFLNVIENEFNIANLEPYIKSCKEQLQKIDVQHDFHCTKFYEYNIEIANFLIKCNSSKEKRAVIILK